MIERTLNGQEIWFIWDPHKEQYLVYFKGDLYYTFNRPATDQNIERLEEEYLDVATELAVTRFLMEISPEYN